LISNRSLKHHHLWVSLCMIQIPNWLQQSNLQLLKSHRRYHNLQVVLGRSQKSFWKIFSQAVKNHSKGHIEATKVLLSLQAPKWFLKLLSMTQRKNKTTLMKRSKKVKKKEKMRKNRNKHKYWRHHNKIKISCYFPQINRAWAQEQCFKRRRVKAKNSRTTRLNIINWFHREWLERRRRKILHSR